MAKANYIVKFTIEKFHLNYIEQHFIWILGAFKEPDIRIVYFFTDIRVRG